jgi:hypothetical protein
MGHDFGLLQCRCIWHIEQMLTPVEVEFILGGVWFEESIYSICGVS